MKKFFIQTYGCQANIKDTQVMAGTLEAMGFESTDNYQSADVIVLNTCSVRQKSEDKVYGWGLKLKKYPIQKREQIVFLTGCMVGSAKGARRRFSAKKLKKILPWVDYFLSPEEETDIPSILVNEGMADEWMLKAIRRDFDYDPKFANKTDWAYVNISSGCDNFCTFCVVPYARGEEKSKSLDEVLTEVKNLSSRGYSDIMLIGQNVNSWGLDRDTKFKLRAGSSHKIPFAELLRSVCRIEKVKKVSFLSANPFDFTQDLIDALTLPQIDRYLHIAVQSGDNEILKKMNRRHTIEEYRELIKKIKKKVPDMRFGTDAIVGFPTETEEQFMRTVKLFEEIKFVVAFISMYSAREGTVAASTMKDDVPLEEKRRRHAYLTNIWKKSLKS